MTKEEVRDYLNSYRLKRNGHMSYIRALQRYVNDYTQINRSPTAILHCRDIVEMIQKERVEVEKLDEVIKCWAKLIPDQTRRGMFVDRYINEMSWYDIQLKYNYCESQAFRCNLKNIIDIASRIT